MNVQTRGILCVFLGGAYALGPTWDTRGQSAKPIPDPKRAFVFQDVTNEVGLLPQVAGIRGHAAGWGDVDGDGWIDLYVGAFHTRGSQPNLFFRNVNGRFKLDEQQALRISGRPTATLLVDLDNDGDLDLYIASMPAAEGSRMAAKEGRALLGCRLLRNEDGGRFTDVSRGNGACPTAFGGRSATVLDYDGDGLLDLLVGEDPHPGYNGSTTSSSRLFRNKGDLRFEDATKAAGIPAGIPGYGVAAADVNGDGWPDVFIAASDGGNLLLVNDGGGKFIEVPKSRETFSWEGSGGDNMVCGVCIADVNRDGLPDIILGQHYDAPWRSPVPVRLYLHRGIREGVPRYEDVTEKAGLNPLPMKAPHVEVQDFDNDGWPDLFVSLVKFDDAGRPHPLIFRNHGARDGVPEFRESVLGINDFPTDADRAVRRSGELFAKVLAEKKIMYMAAAPSGDFDNDGRLDLFMANWWVESRSLLLRNETNGGNWIDVRVEDTGGINRMGIGARVNVYRHDQAGDASTLLGWREIATGYGYASGQPAVSHFGLGPEQEVDVEVVLPHGKGIITRKRVKANQRLVIKPQEEP